MQIILKLKADIKLRKTNGPRYDERAKERKRLRLRANAEEKEDDDDDEEEENKNPMNIYYKWIKHAFKRLIQTDAFDVVFVIIFQD